jgi:RHS repeat-associated protein
MKEFLKQICLIAPLLLAAIAPASFAAQATETLIFIHTDIAGSVIGQSNAAGNVIWRENYRPYGERTVNSSAAAANRQFFHGKAFDADMGLSYFGARYYDPVVGRFMGVDPQHFDESNLHSFNRFAYGNNNPLKYADKDGEAAALLLPIFTWMAVGAVTSGGMNAAIQYASTGSVRWGGIGGVLDAAGEGAMLGPLALMATRGATAANAVRGGTVGAKGATDHIVVGIRAEGLEQAATQIGARHLLNDPNWRASLQTAIRDPSTKFTISVEGFSGSSVYSKLMGAAQRGLGPSARSTEWEVGQLYQAGRLGEATIMQGGKVVANPLAP